jgi:hypothetical protein
MRCAPANRRILGSGILALLLLQPASVTAQTDGDPIVVGTYRVLHSRILEEDRVLQVHLPRDYESETVAYPVVFVFYSDWVEGYFTQLVNDLYHLSMDRMPRTILVGVRNTQRYRDLLPWARLGGQPEEGRADRFLQFVREELIPFVEREYRTKPFRVLVGPQAAAVFGIYARWKRRGRSRPSSSTTPASSITPAGRCAASSWLSPERRRRGAPRSRSVTMPHREARPASGWTACAPGCSGKPARGSAGGWTRSPPGPSFCRR